MPLMVICHQCGASLMRSPSRIAAHVFCNKECRRLFITTPLVHRFWRHVHKTETCWLWQGACTRGGYGVFGIGPRQTTAHRVAWQLTYGTILFPDVEVCHNCPEGDNPLCVNPAHLWLGTQKDNMHDMIKKQRQYRGNRHLTDEQARYAKRMRGIISQDRLAVELGVIPSVIQQIHDGRSYRDILLEPSISMCSLEELAE